MTDRFSPWALLGKHLSSLRDHRPGRTWDWTALAVLWVVPTVAAFVMGCVGTITMPAGWFTGVALLTGGLIGSFSYIAGLRVKLAERESTFPEGEAQIRQYLDETVAHILTAAYVSALTAIILVIEMNLNRKLDGLLAALPTWPSVYLLLLITMILPRLFQAYEELNNVLRSAPPK